MSEKAAKFTPGPWTVDGPPWNQIVWSSAENRVCFLAHTNGLDDGRDIATGRLIAAAPEMFEALKAAQSFLTDLVAGEPPALLVPDGVDPNDFANAFDSASSAIRAALSKAGEAR